MYYIKTLNLTAQFSKRLNCLLNWKFEQPMEDWQFHFPCLWSMHRIWSFTLPWPQNVGLSHPSSSSTHTPCFQSIQSQFPAAQLVHTLHWKNSPRKWSSNRVLTKICFNSTHSPSDFDSTIYSEMLLLWQNAMLCSEHAVSSAGVRCSQNCITILCCPTLTWAVR